MPTLAAHSVFAWLGVLFVRAVGNGSSIPEIPTTARNPVYRLSPEDVDGAVFPFEQRRPAGTS